MFLNYIKTLCHITNSPIYKMKRGMRNEIYNKTNFVVADCTQPAGSVAGPLLVAPPTTINQLFGVNFTMVFEMGFTVCR